MAVKHRPDAGPTAGEPAHRQPGGNPKRRRCARPTGAIRGELFLNCSCTVFCPCVVSLGKHPPTDGTCKAWMAIAIDDGHYEGESFVGSECGADGRDPGQDGRGATGRSRPYIDDRASGKAYNGLLQILSGAAGGTTGLFTLLVSEIIRRRSARRSRSCGRGRKRGLYVGRKIQGEIEMIDGASPDHPVVISNTKYWMGPDVIAARGAQVQGARFRAGLGPLRQVGRDLRHRLVGIGGEVRR